MAVDGRHGRESYCWTTKAGSSSTPFVGIGAQASRSAQKWKPRLGVAAYPVGSIIAGVRSRGWRLRVEVDQQLVSDVDVPVLMVGLALGMSIGGGARSHRPPSPTTVWSTS